MRTITLLRLCELCIFTPPLDGGTTEILGGKKLKKKPNITVVMLTLESIFAICIR